jgi:hypothetical protein
VIETSQELSRATDNDIVLKAVCYRLTSTFWPGLGVTCHVGVLGAARYVVRAAVDRATLRGDKTRVHAELAALLDGASLLEPSVSEIELASEMEIAAQRAGVSLDSGESQLAAMICLRGIDLLETGDKRAILGLETVLDQIERLRPICGRVRSLEQIVRALIADEQTPNRLTEAICSEPAVDKALSICFSCFSGREGATNPTEGLDSYIADLRRHAPRVLVA